MAIQMAPKRPKKLKEGQNKSNLTYSEEISKMQKYLTVNGMFELKNQEHKYEPRNTTLNKNSTDWKVYPTEVSLNEYGLEELKIDLSDAVLQGTSDSI
jgi:hypothetical protein